jgi:molybdate transport system substrate-binding protein
MAALGLPARLVLALALATTSPAYAQDNLLVFAAASLKNALDEADAAFAARSGRRVAVSYAASSALARQIEAGAPAQVFISADLEWMDYLETRQRLRQETRRNLLGNRLVWIAPAASPLPARPLDALGKAGRLALADPQYVPAGKYAKAALEKMGAWPSIANRIAAAENVRAALALVARGEAPLGIVYETDAGAEPKVRVIGQIDAALHPPIVYPAALLRDASSAAEEYLHFLAAEQARGIFRRHGFTPLD